MTDDDRQTFDAATIPGMRARLAEPYRLFRAAEAAVLGEVVKSGALRSPGAWRERDCPLHHKSPAAPALVLSSRGLDLVACQICGLTYSKAVMDETIESNLYADPVLDRARTALHLSAPYLEMEIRRSQYYLRRLGRYAAPGAMLEVGCGYGTFLIEAERVGWRTMGIDRSLTAAKSARHRGAQVVHGLFPHAAPVGKTYDAIVLLDVLEHAKNPLALLGEVRSRLSPGGVLFIQVPNWESLLVQVQGGESSIICPGHWSYFSAASLTKLMARGGFVALDATTVQSEADRLSAYDRQEIMRALQRLRPGEREPPGPDEIYRLGLGYKLIGIFRASDR